jgi:hypothetical protein
MGERKTCKKEIKLQDILHHPLQETFLFTNRSLKIDLQK